MIKEMSSQDLLREIKKEFFSLRNGVIADSLKKLYPSDTIIFGLNVPQFMDLAKKYPKDIELGLELWKDKKCRESRLFSLYIIPPSQLVRVKAKEMIRDVKSIEEAEFLAFKVLRNLKDAREIYEEISKEEMKEPLSSYCVSMFKKNLLAQ